MNKNATDPQYTQNVKQQFDEILVKHIRRLLEIDTLASSLSFNLSTIACLLLLVERENEIKQSPASPPEKFTRETFLDELAELGVEIDDTLMNSFKTLAQHEYVSIDKDNRYNAQIATFAIVSFLDNLFPDMKGLNLVGYVLQMIDEVTSGRKDLDTALSLFDSMLMSKGIPLSKQSLETTQKETLKEPVKRVVKKTETVKMSEEFKKALDQKLSRLRTSSRTGQAAGGVISSADSLVKKTRIQEIFPKGPSEKELRQKEIAEKEAREAEEAAAREAAEKAAREAEIAAAEQAALEAQKKAAEIAAREAELKAKEAEAKAAEIAAREAEMKAREAELKAREAEITAKNVEKTETETAPEAVEEKVPPKVDVEKQIANFEQQIAMPCPICQIGKILSGTSEKGQEYFSCTNENCGFISWGKPFSFSCPVCSNAFLIEFATQEGVHGLKCPRATCSYRQPYIGPPSHDPDTTDKPKKKRKLIRRVKRR